MKWPLLLFFVLLYCTANAAPNLDVYRDIQGILVYQDHQQKNIWYLTPAAPQIARSDDNTPDYGLDVFRYHGRKGTGDQGAFLVRGILSVAVERKRPSGVTMAIRKVLSNSGIKNPRLRSMPVSGAEIKLLFADQGASWQQKSRWTGRQILLPLPPEMTEALWDGVEKGQTLMSLAVEEQLSGRRLIDKEWQDMEVSSSWILPIEMDMAAHPTKFRKTDLGGRMSHGYTGIDVFCFDFIEELDQDLYAKKVRVAIPTTGRDLIEEITFRDDGQYRFRLDFKYAKGMDWPYQVQIVRIMRDGRRETTPWIKKQGESMLDITAYREPEESSEEDIPISE